MITIGQAMREWAGQALADLDDHLTDPTTDGGKPQLLVQHPKETP